MVKILRPAAIFFSLFLLVNCSKNNGAPVQAQRNGNVISNIQYGSGVDWQGQTQSLTMDIYLPAQADPGKKYPLFLFIHGGGFTSGDKSSSAEKCQLMADSGFVAVTINYRLGWNTGGVNSCNGDTASLNEAVYRSMQDANAAFRYLVVNAAQYGIDTDWIFAGGASAGAAVALTSSYIFDNYAQLRYQSEFKKIGGLQGADNNLVNTYTIKGICSIAGALPDSNLINSTNAIPTIFFQGGADEVVPVDYGTFLSCPNYIQTYGSLCLYRRLIANNQFAIAHILPGAGHGNNGDSGYDSPYMMGNTACFFHSIMRKEKPVSGIYIGVVNSCN